MWSRNWKGVYYLGQVSGEWEYSEKPEHRRADVVNFRRCQWLKVGAADEVPGAVRNSFSRGRVLQAVDSMPALNYSGKLFDELSGKLEYIALYTDHPNDLFALLSHSALEDLVGLYLQSLGYSIVPSTCCRTSAVYEFVLRHREDGRMATVQVKAGEASIEMITAISQERCFCLRPLRITRVMNIHISIVYRGKHLRHSLMATATCYPPPLLGG